MTWDYWDHFQSEWRALQGSGPLTGYRRCVLAKASRKVVMVGAAALRTLYACTAVTVVAAWMDRVLGIVRQLQLLGGECPLTGKFDDLVSGELYELVKNMLARKHTGEELLCLGKALQFGAVNPGDQTKAYYDAVENELTARMRHGSAPTN